jgi:hypothetical protein
MLLWLINWHWTNGRGLEKQQPIEIPSVCYGWCALRSSVVDPNLKGLAGSESEIRKGKFFFLTYRVHVSEHMKAIWGTIWTNFGVKIWVFKFSNPIRKKTFFGSESEKNFCGSESEKKLVLIHNTAIVSCASLHASHQILAFIYNKRSESEKN